jgi:hypothetical protein
MPTSGGVVRQLLRISGLQFGLAFAKVKSGVARLLGRNGGLVIGPLPVVSSVRASESATFMTAVARITLSAPVLLKCPETVISRRAQVITSTESSARINVCGLILHGAWPADADWTLSPRQIRRPGA